MKAKWGKAWAVLGVVLGLSTTLTVQAVPNAVVETVQSPAWVERAGQRLPLAAGMALKNRDRLLTGEGARVIVHLADGSAFRIGENSVLTVNAMQQGKNGVFVGALDLKAGDLRLVSHEFAEAPVKRSINVRFGQLTAAVRGEADITGTAEGARDSVTLRDGKAVFMHPLMAAMEIDTPLQVVQASPNKVPESAAAVDRFQGAAWALRTQPLYDAATQQSWGRWMLRFGVFDKPAALALFDQLREAGFSSQIQPVRVQGGQRYELRLPNLVGEHEAQRLAERLSSALSLPVAAVIKR